MRKKSRIPTGILILALIAVIVCALAVSLSDTSEPTPSDVPAWAPGALSYTSEPTDSSPPSQDTAPGMSSSPDTPPAMEPFTMTFGGDVLVASDVASKLGSGEDYTRIIDPALVDLFHDSTLSFVNLESPYSTRGTPAPDKQYTFRGAPKHLTFLTTLGISAVTLANNHTLDFGAGALEDTLDGLDALGVGHAGAGRDLDEAQAPCLLTVGGRTVAFLAASRVIPVTTWNAGPNSPGLFTTYDPAALNAAIAAARQHADLVVVYVHWGEERNPYPKDYQVNMARGYIDAGADLVIGSHPHVLQGLEYYKGKWIAYSLGNLIFTDATKDTMALQFTVSGDMITPQAIFCRIRNMRTELVTDPDDRASLSRYLESISYQVTVDADGFIGGQ